MKLVNFLMKLQNEVVQVELKNGTTVKGTILSVSPAMNINMKDATMVIPNRDTTKLDHITIRGSQVRLVLLPDELDCDAILQDAAFRSKAKPVKTTETIKAPKRVARSQNRGF